MNDKDIAKRTRARQLVLPEVVRGVADEETLFKLLLTGTTNVRASGAIFDLIQYMQAFWPDPIMRGQSKTKTIGALVQLGIRSLPNSLKILSDFDEWAGEVRLAQDVILAEQKAADEKMNGVKVPLLDLLAVETVEVDTSEVDATVDTATVDTATVDTDGVVGD